MSRSTRVRRLIVAFLVVLALAVAVRFARATDSDAVAGPQGCAAKATRYATEKNAASSASRHTMLLLGE